MSTDWKVTFDGDFWSQKGRGCREIPINTNFFWAGKQFYLPAVYLCGKGIVLDLCMQIDPKDLLSFMEKWDLFHEELHPYSKESRRKIEKENPLGFAFQLKLLRGKKVLPHSHGCGISWIPQCCLPEEMIHETDCKKILAHYHLSPEFGWSIRRFAFRWNTTRPPKYISPLILQLSADPQEFEAPSFKTPDQKEIILAHPITKENYTLTVTEETAEKLDLRHFPHSNMEFPPYYRQIVYSLSPDPQKFTLRLSDRVDSDEPRQIKTDTADFLPDSTGSIGIIGGADGPTSVLLASASFQKLYTACSSLHFEPKEFTEWIPSFLIKMHEDLSVVLIE